MKNYASYSFWLEHCDDDLTPRPPLDGSTSVDVAILGAGFTGLWTAYYLHRRDPSLKIAILEAEIAGFGASGRNGGWCYAEFPVRPLGLLQRYGYDSARAVSLAMYDSVDEVGRVAAEEGIDAHYAKGGALEVARAEYDLPILQQMYDGFRAIGLEDHYEVLDPDQTRVRVNVPRAVGSLWEREGAAIQPARLARGLARAVERGGVQIFEQTRVTDYVGGKRPKFITEVGEVSARVIVLAGEAYLSALPKSRRDILPLTSHMVVTEPLTDAQWADIGWRKRDVLGGFGTSAGYLNHTTDGRIAFGAYRANYPFNSRITDELDRDEAIFDHARRSLIAWFPNLAGVKFTHAWGGVFGVPRDHMPTMAYDPATGIATGQGYTGEGVATANLSGRVLADLITGTDSDLTQLPMTSHKPKSWEPEPFRKIGAALVKRSLMGELKHVERTGEYSERRSLSSRLWEF